jgi:hypothetical protein
MSGETGGNTSGWTTDTALTYTLRQIQDLRTMLDERYATQTKALDAAFVASERAVQAALTSAEKAVAKAETASERRFDSVNEFRAQLSDVISSNISRVEAEARFTALGDRLTHLENQVNINSGTDQGAAQATANRRASTQQAVAVVGVMITLISVAVILILGLNS